MNIKVKKIIAREILILIPTVLIVSLIYFVNRYLIDRYDEQREIVHKELAEIDVFENDTPQRSKLPFAVRVKLLISENKIESLNYSDSDFYFVKYLDKVFVDSVFDELGKNYPIKSTRQEFHVKIDNSIRASQIAYTKCVALVDESISLLEKGNLVEKISIALLLTLLTIIYPARLLYYLSRWSIKTVREKS